MRSEEHYQRDVATIPTHASARRAAEELRRRGLGSLVVMDQGTPVGIVTDRDLLVRVIAEERDPDQTTVGDVMSEPFVSVEPDSSLERVVDAMARYGIRRVGVVRDGELVGLVSLDDLAASLSDELRDLTDAIRRQFGGAQRIARARRVARDLEEALGDLGGTLQEVGAETRETVLRQFDLLREKIQRHGS